MMLSLIVPTYNSEKYLDACLESIKNQTFTDFECIVVDDGSTDNSRDIVERYAQSDGRFILISNPHRGVSFARNAGIDVARGEYIGFVDSDDTIQPDMFEWAIGLIIRNNVPMLKMNGNVYCPMVIHPDVPFAPYIDLGYTWSVLYKRAAIGNIRFPEDMSLCEDLYFAIKVFDSCGSCYVVRESKYNYIRRAGSLTTGTRCFNGFRLLTIPKECTKLSPTFIEGYICHLKRIMGKDF